MDEKHTFLVRHKRERVY